MKSAWVSASDFVKGFADQAGGTAFGDQFIKQNPGIDVVFQVAGLTGNGVIDAACAAGINAIGVDVDQYNSYAASQKCLVTSAEKHLAIVRLDLDPADRRQVRQGRPRLLQRRQQRHRRVDLHERGGLGPGPPVQDRRGDRGHEGRVHQDLPAGTRLREDPGTADRQLTQTL